MADRPLSEKLNHVVVLMFENRSFDHMLAEGPDVTGLAVGFPNAALL